MGREKTNNSKKRKRYYAVICGHNSGIFDEWSACRKQVDE